MADKLMYIIEITPSLDFYYCLKSLDTQLNAITNQNSIKVPEAVKPINNKTFFKSLGTSAINILMSPPSMILYMLNLTPGLDSLVTHLIVVQTLVDQGYEGIRHYIKLPFL